MTTDLDKDAQKRVMKEAMQEWLDKKLAEFGWWTMKGLGALAVSALLWAAFKTGGFK